jgi:hypothetical protein
MDSSHEPLNLESNFRNAGDEPRPDPIKDLGCAWIVLVWLEYLVHTM